MYIYRHIACETSAAIDILLCSSIFNVVVLLLQPGPDIERRSYPHQTLLFEKVTLLLVEELAPLLEKHLQFLWQVYHQEDRSERQYTK